LRNAGKAVALAIFKLQFAIAGTIGFVIDGAILRRATNRDSE
jgi:hypothetical protein